MTIKIKTEDKVTIKKNMTSGQLDSTNSNSHEQSGNKMTIDHLCSQQKTFRIQKTVRPSDSSILRSNEHVQP